MISYSATALIYDALCDINVMVPNRTASVEANFLQLAFRTLNQMLDSWALNRLMVFQLPATIFPLTAGIQQYTIGPTNANFIATRPTQIDAANVILNTFNPVVRYPVAIIDVERWAKIRVQQLPYAIPQVLYYDKGYDPTYGFATINIWPGPLTSYTLEIYTWQQQLMGFPDLTTPVNFPPGYASAIRYNFAVMIAPAAKIYFKAEPSLEMVDQLARQTKADVESYNAPLADIELDPAFSGVQS